MYKRQLAERARRIVVVEASAGQLEDEMRLALSRAGFAPHLSIEAVERYGGVLPSTDSVVQHVLEAEEVRS